MSRNAVSSPPPQQNSESGEIELLEGKLQILEEVVKELYHRENKRKDDDSIATNQQQQLLEQELENANALEKDQSEQIDLFKEQLVLKEEHIERLKVELDLKTKEQAEKTAALTERLEQECNQKDEELASFRERLLRVKGKFERDIEVFEGELAGKEDELVSWVDKFETQVLQSDEAIAQLTKRLASQEMELEAEVQRVKTEADGGHQAALLDKEDEIAILQLQVTEYKEKIRSLQADVDKLSEGDSDRGEQLEIATAAVHAAEKREKAGILDLEESERKLKQAHVFLKLQRLTLRGRADEHQERDEENERLKEALKNAREQVATAQAAQAQSESQSIWRRIKSRVLKT
jgi:hypothetical protein